MIINNNSMLKLKKILKFSITSIVNTYLLGLRYDCTK